MNVPPCMTAFVCSHVLIGDGLSDYVSLRLLLYIPTLIQSDRGQRAIGWDQRS